MDDAPSEASVKPVKQVEKGLLSFDQLSFSP
jgi:hypothetical protein